MSSQLVGVKKLHEDAILPEYAHLTDSGADLYSTEELTLKPMDRQLVNTGIALELPDGYEAQIRPKSGLAIKQGLTVLNTPGTIDMTYRGEIKVILINLSMKPVIIEKGQKIAQLVIAPVFHAIFQEVETISGTQRGSGGFGSTGLKKK